MLNDESRAELGLAAVFAVCPVRYKTTTTGRPAKTAGGPGQIKNLPFPVS